MSIERVPLNPFPWYAALRATAPVHRDAWGGWSVFRYDDVQRVLSEHETFSSRVQGSANDPDNPLGSSLINTDPPRHRRLRSLVSQAFTPRKVAALEPRIAEIAAELLSPVARSGQMDVVGDFAYPLPVIVIAQLLGIPARDRARFKRWSDVVVSNGQSGDYVQTQREMSAYFRDTIERHRRQPADDLISALLAAQEEGEHLSDLDLLGFCILLLVAGNETTTNLIANAVLCFDEHPEVVEQLRAHPERLPSTIEEVLRYRSPVQSMYRVAVTETEIGGQRIAPGQSLVAWIGSANHDERQFPDPERFDFERTPNRHLAFGQGIHFCLGAPLARLEARVALAALLDVAPDLRRRPDVKLEAIDSDIVYGVKTLPVTFTTQKRRAA